FRQESHRNVMRLFLLLALVVAETALALTATERLTAAIKQAIDTVDLVNVVAEDTIGTDKNPHTQIANENSKDAQKIGDIVQEATRLLVAEHGAAGLAQFNGIDILGVIEKHLGPKFNNRKKRQYGSELPPQDNCINRPPTCDRSFPFRSISGWCNHDDTPNRGMGSTMGFIRRFMGAAKYDDGFNSVRRLSANGGQLPSARAISNKILAEGAIPAFDPLYNHMFMQYGQWIAHDLIFTPSAVGINGASLDCSLCESADLTPNCAPIEVPADDTYFPTKTAAGKKNCIRVTRGINGQTGLGPRAQINQNSHFLDLSQVYGSTDCVAKELRTMKDGQMLMFTADGYTLPPKALNDTNCQSAKVNSAFKCFTAGDSRNSLQPGLIPIHTIYLRQHNKWASQIRQLRPTWSDNLVYEETRRLLVAMYQYHIYADYLPKVVGTKLMAQYDLTPGSLRRLYDSRINPSITAEFGTAAFRFGHSQARKDVPRMTNSNV
ncbi:hypothetical protein PFISCL1PPCAC_6867, partial [Pristionchus fissidentatus]